jgi:uncharacterized protein (TIGR03435 family)
MGKRILLTVLAAVSLAGAAIPQFDVVSIKPCKVDLSGGVRAGNIKTSPGRLTVTCVPLRNLIQHAYLIYANGRYRDFNFYDVPIEGAPGWAQSERYTIEATTQALPSDGTMNGPMLQALLEDRFHLKIHRETREAPIYELTVAKGGPKLQPFDGSCTPVDWAEATLEPGDCRNVAGESGLNATRFWRAISIDDFTMAVLDKQFTGRAVVNKTGIAGVFDIHLEFTPEQNSAAADAGPSIFTAVQEQLGLKLVPARGQEEFLVIDSVERPSEN